MVHLFIDTNAYLTFYHLSNEDLEELKKLRALIKNKKIVLHLPEQTIDEFNRNREVKIADALKRFKEDKLNNIFPQICKHHPEYKKMLKAVREFTKNKDKLLNILLEEVESQSLPADQLINELFNIAEVHETNNEIILEAKERFDLGKPPGKNKS